MVRNIDLPEAVVLYGTDVVVVASPPSVPTGDSDNINNDELVMVRDGLESLLQDCHADGAVVFWLMDDDNNNQDDDSNHPAISKWLSSSQQLLLQVRHARAVPPNPFDLLVTCLESVPDFEPRPFGGSSGFGARQWTEPARCPVPARTVVLTCTTDQTRAARLAGMRAVRVTTIRHDDDDDDDDPLADAVMMDDVIDFTIDDISTPGSFWLNPPSPRDDEGNKVDPYQLMEQFQQKQQKDDDTESTATIKSDDGDDDDTSTSDGEPTDEELRRMLADIDPL